jgi:hypothetical protein
VSCCVLHYFDICAEIGVLCGRKQTLSLCYTYIHTVFTVKLPEHAKYVITNEALRVICETLMGTAQALTLVTALQWPYSGLDVNMTASHSALKMRICGDIPLIPHTSSWPCIVLPPCRLFSRTARYDTDGHSRVSLLLCILDPEGLYTKDYRGFIQFSQVTPTIIYYFQIW